MPSALKLLPAKPGTTKTTGRRSLPRAAGRHDGAGSSQAPTRVRMLDEPPSVDAGEITDKGYINQRAVLARRAGEVIALYSNVPDPRTVRL